jgi:hypothetical protein
MIDWYVLLTPLLVLPIFLLFRFVGCDALFGLTHVDPVYSYEDTVKAEQSLVAYWRLGDQNTPQAKDEKGSHPGLYGQPPASAAHSNSQGSSGEALQGQAGLYGADTSVDFEGGYVVVPFSPDLNTPSFTIEALVFPGAWEDGFDHAVVVSAEIEGTAQRGFAVFGKWDPAEQKSFWTAAMGTGTIFIELRGPEVKMPATKTYVALTHDAGSGTTTLYVATGDSWDAVTPTMVSGYTQIQSNNLYIGADSNAVPAQPLPPPPPQAAPPVDVPFIGRIQEVALYNAALNEATLAKRRVF